MKLSGRRFPRRTAWALTVLAGATAAFVAGPSRGQQNAAAVHHSAPVTASAGEFTRATLDFTVPAGVRLERLPRFRVTDAKGEGIELVPALPTTGTLSLPSGTCYRDLHTGRYPPGVYLVRAELLYPTTGGKTTTVASAPTTLVVPQR
jgi:hypothetical protein